MPSMSDLGEFIRRQRALQELTFRQLAGMAGISNPYLSQIERGLREQQRTALLEVYDAFTGRRRRKGS